MVHPPIITADLGSVPVRIGTRGSELALVQAKKVQNRLQQQYPTQTFEIVVITTAGDKDTQSHLSEIGGKGVFIKELETALMDHQIDLAVHSLKDVTSTMPKTLTLTAFLKPESISDTVVFRHVKTLSGLPSGAKIGTGSIRRKALFQSIRPDLICVPIRGNVQTRLKKLVDQDLDAIVLSEAGLIRLGIQPENFETLKPIDFTPAPGQGVIAIQTREEDQEVRQLCESINDPDQALISRAEQACLSVVGFDCQIPLGLLTTKNGTMLKMSAFLANEQLDRYYKKEVTGSVEEHLSLGQTLGEALKQWLTQS